MDVPFQTITDGRTAVEALELDRIAWRVDTDARSPGRVRRTDVASQPGPVAPIDKRARANDQCMRRVCRRHATGIRLDISGGRDNENSRVVQHGRRAIDIRHSASGVDGKRPVGDSRLARMSCVIFDRPARCGENGGHRPAKVVAVYDLDINDLCIRRNTSVAPAARPATAVPWGLQSLGELGNASKPVRIRPDSSRWYSLTPPSKT
jgi:hypothetical protein